MSIGASIGKMTNLSPIETCCGCFSERRTFFVIGCCLSVALIFDVGPTSSWVLLFLFTDEGLASIDCISWLTSCICTRICCMV
jgi:hypothetical protein